MRKHTARVARGLLATACLLLLTVGGAVALVIWGRLEVWRTITWQQLWQLPADMSVLLGAMTVIGWLAWLMVTATVVTEWISAVTHWRPKLPGGWLRLAIGALVMSALGLAVAASSGVRPAHVAPVQVVAQAMERASQIDSAEKQTTPYLVKAGDDLWSLAERFAGGGDNWRVIADANSTSVLDPGTHLVPGTLLMVPAVVPQVVPQDAPVGTVTVQKGDTLWGLAKTHLGNPYRWPEIFQANKDVIKHPELIHPGQVLKLPGAVVAPAPSPSPQPPPQPEAPQPQEPPVPQPVKLPPLAGTLIEVSRPSDKPPIEGRTSTAQQPDQTTDQMIRALIGSIGAGLAGALLAGIATHRLLALRSLPPGRVLPRTGQQTKRVETALDKRVADGASQIKKGDGPAKVATVVLGRDAEGREVTTDLCQAGVLAIDGEADRGQGLMAALAAQLLTADGPDYPDVVLAHPSLEWLAKLLDCPMTPPVDAWRQVKRRAISYAAWTGGDAWQHAVDQSGGVDGLRDAGGAEGVEPLIVFLDPAAIEQPGLVRPQMGVTVVTAIGHPGAGTLAEGSADLVVEFADDDTARLWPQGRSFNAQLILPPARRALIDLVDALTSENYEPAPWAQPAPEKRLHIIGELETQPEKDETSVMTEQQLDDHPQLRLLGPVELVGARGVSPARADKQCMEYCGWLLRYPGQTAATMVESLLVAEGTRRSNMSRLRVWLGADPEGEPYLPDAYSGRIRLHPGVTSDWEAMLVLVHGGVERVPEASLVAALKLVRGAPLADAAPGQWHWAEEWRCDMVALIRDIGVVLCDKALLRDDVELARWAAGQALMAAPDDDRLMICRLRTEHAAGNRREVDRLAYHITRSSKLMGYDLSDAMVITLQEIIEGSSRARLAG